ncbi:MAG: hypothetical protein IPG87_08790 [Saprospiraceae bacterium]|nr:hypothetical protein [Candidatus Vicinibacter affinis]
MLKPFLLIIFIPFISWTQSELFIGQWTTHLPYNNGLQITQSEDYIYYATAFSLCKLINQTSAQKNYPHRRLIRKSDQLYLFSPGNQNPRHCLF